MFKKGPVPAFVHGLLEYAAGVLFLVAPFLLDFEENAATAASIVAGVLILAFTASTAMSTGLIKSIPVQAHVMIDYVLAIALIAAPFVLGFSDDGAATAFFMALGVLYLLLTIATRFIREPRRDAARSASPSARRPRRRYWARARGSARSARRLPRRAPRAARRRARRHAVPRPARRGRPAAHRPARGTRAGVGRGAGNEVALPWDPEVSRLHAELELVGGSWLVCDDRLSHNGTYVNGERLHGRRRLRSGDVITAGGTQLAFVAPAAGAEDATRTAGRASGAVAVTPAQRRVLVALCRPVGDGGAPASNRDDRGRARARARHGQGRAVAAVRDVRHRRRRAAEPEARRARPARARPGRRDARRAAQGSIRVTLPSPLPAAYTWPAPDAIA